MARKADKRYCVVLLQNRKGSKYNDFIGKFYHFPKKYLKLLSRERLEFVYYEPKRHGDGVYFGYGKISRIFPDRREKDCFFAEITDSRSFSDPVPFYSNDGKPRESGSTYNAQNAVRTISCSKLDGICLDGGIILSFKADAHLVRVLGEELIANERVGILELIKNAYDAGASECLVRVEDVPGIPPVRKAKGERVGPVITIQDNGRGMNRDTIENGWLRPASTLKTNVKERLKRERAEAERTGKLGVYNSFVRELKRQHAGRIPLGEKGVGRFATHRLGRYLTLTTKQKDERFEFLLEIDWTNFEPIVTGGDFVDLESIGVILRRQPPSRNYGESDSGTCLTIHGGKPGFSPSRNDLEDLSDSVAMLKSPYHGAERFEVTLEIPQLADTSAEKPIFERFDPQFDFIALVNAEGIAELDLGFCPPANVPLPPQRLEDRHFDLRKMDDDKDPYWRTSSGEFRKPACGEFFLGIKAWYRRSPWIDGPDARKFLSYLDQYGGISVFRDGLNILPASLGTSHDWLHLSTRHIKKGTHISYYAMIGACEITQNANIRIVDKTDRQGLLENQAFKDLSRLVRSCVLFVENQYKAQRETYETLREGVIREPRTLAAVSRESASVMERLRDAYDFSKDTLELFPDLVDASAKTERIVNLTVSLKSLQKSLKAMEDVQELLTEQAGFGLAVAVSVHEIAKIASNFYNGVVAVLHEKRLNRTNLEELRDTSESLKSELSRFSPLRTVRNERPFEFQVGKSVRFVNSIFRSVLEREKIDLRIELDKDISVYARYGAFNQVLNNLVDNAIYWLRQVPASKRSILVRLDTKHRHVLVADSGPGLDPSIRPYLFKPGYSLRVPPSGLGLYVASYYLLGMGGSIREAGRHELDERYGGAHFVIDLSRVPDAKEKAR
jgi:signal transduction histidine kinase